MIGRINTRKLVKNVVVYFFALVTLLVFLSPFAWLVLSSFQRDVDLISIPPRILPKRPTLTTYRKLLGFRHIEEDKTTAIRTFDVPPAARMFPRVMLNSAIVSTSTTLLCLLTGSLSAYSLARLKFRGSKIFFLGTLATRMIPGLTLIIPFFLLANFLKLLNSKLLLVLVYSTFTLPYTIWVLRAYFETIPPDLEDAARIDGCGRIATLWKIILPIAQPGLVGAAVFVFMLAWNEFFFALILTNTVSAFTVPVVAAMFATELDINYSMMITAGVVSVLPPILFTFIFQRFILSGLSAGALKS